MLYCDSEERGIERERLSGVAECGNLACVFGHVTHLVNADFLRSPPDMLYHIYTHLGQSVGHIPVRADHILSTWANETKQLTFSKHGFECKVVINHLAAGDTDVRSVW